MQGIRFVEVTVRLYPGQEVTLRAKEGSVLQGCKGPDIQVIGLTQHSVQCAWGTATADGSCYDGRGGASVAMTTVGSGGGNGGSGGMSTNSTTTGRGGIGGSG